MEGNDDGMTHRMNDVVAGFQSIVSAHMRGHTTKQHDHTDVDPGDDGCSGDASAQPMDVPANVNVAAVDFPHGSIVFLNTTSPNYLLIDYANATVVVWTEPVNATTVATQTKLRQLVNNINTVLPYIEACGLLAVVWEISKFVHARIQARRRRSRSSAAEEVP